METFAKLFGSLVVFVYHCFDRMVILGHMQLLTRPEHIVHFFRDVHGTYPITREALRQRTDEYHRRARRGHTGRPSRSIGRRSAHALPCRSSSAPTR
jgi:hypothetical protein